MTNLQRTITHTAYLPNYELSRRVARLFPNDYILETDSPSFNLREFAKGNRCSVKLREELYGQFTTHWMPEEGGVVDPKNAFMDVLWKDAELRVLRITQFLGDTEFSRHWIVSKDEGAAKAFFAAVCQWSAEIRSEILVFFGGRWVKDSRLFKSIKTAKLDDLVLPEGMREALRADVVGFFDAKETYERYDIAWKRGILLIGPPGNGKTHMVKALINESQKPCLYVRSLRTNGYNVNDCVQQVFARARRASPCLLIFEDLDSMIEPSNRSSFLNELDGFASNNGILVLATTNYPEKLDPAILERPSRFDRKYAFELPATAERRRYIAARNAKLAEGMRLTEETIDLLADATAGFSFAYLQELAMSMTMVWMRECVEGSMDGIALAQMASLLSQMRTPAPAAKPSEEAGA